MRSYQENLHVFSSQFCAQEEYSKTTLRRWKWQRQMENPLKRCLQKSNRSNFAEKLPRNAETGSVSTLKIFAFLTTLYSTQLVYSTCVLTIHAEMSKSGVKEMEILVEGKE